MLAGMVADAPKQRVALVTGGAKRVGAAIVRRLAADGFHVAFTYHRSEEGAEALAEDLSYVHAGQRFLRVRADLTDPQASVPEVHLGFTQQFERLDVLVNNASLYQPARLAEASVEQSRRLWAIHVEAPMLLCRSFAPMLRASRGHVINMVDLLAERPWPQYLAYCASKAGLWNLTLGLARELAPEVTVNGIAPGVVEWPDDYPEAERQKYLKRVPLARPGTPGDVAETVVFLCTAGSYITGQVIRLDGGRSIT
jgi:pteridine reductase